jgi:hypothetical protein
VLEYSIYGSARNVIHTRKLVSAHCKLQTSVEKNRFSANATSYCLDSEPLLSYNRFPYCSAGLIRPPSDEDPSVSKVITHLKLNETSDDRRHEAHARTLPIEAQRREPCQSIQVGGKVLEPISVDFQHLETCHARDDASRQLTETRVRQHERAQVNERLEQAAAGGAGISADDVVVVDVQSTVDDVQSG